MSKHTYWSITKTYAKNTIGVLIGICFGALPYFIFKPYLHEVSNQCGTSQSQVCEEKGKATPEPRPNWFFWHDYPNNTTWLPGSQGQPPNTCQFKLSDGNTACWFDPSKETGDEPLVEMIDGELCVSTKKHPETKECRYV